MKQIYLIFIMFFMAVSLFAQRTFVIQANYNSADGSTWTNYNLYDDGTHGDVTANDGIYSFADVITVAYSSNVQKDWIVVETTDGGWTAVTDYIWLIQYKANQNILFTYDINNYSDDWLPAENITNTDDQPNTKTFMPFYLDGARDGDMYDDGDLAGKGDETAGDGIWARKITIPTAGNHTWYTYSYDVNYSGEHRWSENGRVKSTSDDIEFTTTKSNQDVYFYINFNTGRILTKLDTPLPVELTTFSASIVNNSVELNWETATEVNNYGFDVERRTEIENRKPETGDRKPESGNWIKVGFVEGAGNSNSIKKYSFTDVNSLAGKFQYRLKQLDIDGNYEYSSIVEVTIGVPEKFEVSQNYPNPFNPTTLISFSIPKTSNVELSVYNILGQKVATLVNKELSAGSYKYSFDASNLTSGIYFYKVSTDDNALIRKMMLLK